MNKGLFIILSYFYTLKACAVYFDFELVKNHTKSLFDIF